MAAPARVARSAKRSRFLRGEAPITKILIALNVFVFLAQLAGGATLTPQQGWIYEHGALMASRCCWSDGTMAGVAHGEWWRLITSAFLHAHLPHLAMNMFVLWWLGRSLEDYLGIGRFLLLYFVSGLAGSAGALVWSPDAITVGASGAIFGLFGALLVMEQMHSPGQMGPVFTIVVINLMIPFVFPSLNISIGGHVGGLIGGALGAIAFSRFGRGHIAYGRPGVVGVAGLVMIGVASVVLSYWRARGYA